MLNLLPLAIGIIAIFAIAKYNKSNKMFWTLLVSMLFGFVCGSLSTTIKNSTYKKNNATNVTSMCVSSTPTTIIIPDNNNGTVSEETFASYANRILEDYHLRDIAFSSFGPTVPNTFKSLGPGVSEYLVDTS